MRVSGGAPARGHSSTVLNGKRAWFAEEDWGGWFCGLMASILCKVRRVVDACAGLVGKGIPVTRPGEAVNKRTAAGRQEGRRRINIMNVHPHWKGCLYQVSQNIFHGICGCEVWLGICELVC